jgi:hypothetical protein
MASKEEILAAAKIVADFAGNPDSGVVADLLRDLKASVPTKEVRVTDVKETR